jgi:tRNA (mo5U34)-methyltransferase
MKDSEILDKPGTLQEAPGAGDPEIDALRPWFHNLHLPDGRQTSPDHRLGDFPRFKWEAIASHLPEDLSGWTAIDIGCNAGFHSIELAKRGARVTAVDVDSHYLRQARWAVERFGLADRVTVRPGNVYELAHSAERYDLVWFTGVLYHLRYPLAAIDAAAGATARLLVMQSLTRIDKEEGAPDDLPYSQRERLSEAGWPAMSFIPGRFAGDPTNWWAPNRACLRAMLDSAGLSCVAAPDEETFICEPTGRTPHADELAALAGGRSEA